MEKVKAKGNLEVWKVYDDGTEELHFSEQNVITSGMGVGLAHLFSGSGSGDIGDFQIVNFQLGTAGDVNNYGVSSFKLNTAVSKANIQTTGSELLVEDLFPIENGVVLGSTKPFVRIPFSNIQKVTATSVRFNLIVDKNSAVDQTINEIGLFMRNPRGSASDPHPILVAYRPFTSLTKTSTFSLLFKWTISF
jgi:hypothetical protein